MTREEIMAMDDVGLCLALSKWFEPELSGDTHRRFAATWAGWPERWLWTCYQAEEKLDSMGLKEERAYHLCALLPSRQDYINVTFKPINLEEIGDLIKSHPKQRARAILMTLDKLGR